MVGLGVYFSCSRCKGTDSIQEVADIPFADNKQSLHYWFIPADSAALTPEPQPMENDLQYSLSEGEGEGGGIACEIENRYADADFA
jgi:hypothetical protein